MGFLRRNDNAKPDFTALQIQTSTSILPIPIVWGQNRIAPNLIWYGNFQAVAGGSGKGIGGKGGLFGGGGAAAAADYTYTADIVMALCEGPIATPGNSGPDSGVGIIYKDLAIYVPIELGLGVAQGTTPQSLLTVFALPPDPVFYPPLAYQGTAYLWGYGYNLGDSAAIGNHNVEIYGVFAGTGVNGIDADPALVINDFLTSPQYGAQFNPASIDATTLFGSGGDASLQTYCRAMGYAFSPVLNSQEQGSSVLARWLKLLNCTAVWSGGKLKFMPYGDTAIAAGSETTTTVQLSVPSPVPESSTTFKPPSNVIVAASANFVSDGGVVYSMTGISLVFIGAVAPTIAGTYGMFPPGQYWFSALDYGQPIRITWTGAPTTSYTPNLTPVYTLTDTDYVDEKGNKDPLQVERVDIYSLPTIQRLNVSSRANQYASTPVEARDQSQIQVFGPRVGSTIDAREVCDENLIGPLMAQAILQRELYVRTKFTFKLSWEYCLLDPMDIVSITDSNLGLANYPARVIEMEEDDKGLLAITCEELVFGVSTPAPNPSASNAGAFQQNWAVPAVPINTPLIFEPNPSLTNGIAQVWFGASGIPGGSSSQWGGANVYLSIDDATYAQIGVLTAPIRQGFLTASLPLATGWDTTNTLSVNIAESGPNQQLGGTSAPAAQAGATLSLVDAELVSYEFAALTSTSAYNLTGLARGFGGSTAAAHSAGAPFARIDGAVAQYDLPANFVGQTLYFKFQSFNVFGGGGQDISTCAVYSFTPQQASTVVTQPPPNNAPPPLTTISAQLVSGTPLNLGSVTAAATISQSFGSVTAGSPQNIPLGALPPGPAYPIAAQIIVAAGAPITFGAVTMAETQADDFGLVDDAPNYVSINLGSLTIADQLLSGFPLNLGNAIVSPAPVFANNFNLAGGLAKGSVAGRINLGVA